MGLSALLVVLGRILCLSLAHVFSGHSRNTSSYLHFASWDLLAVVVSHVSILGVRGDGEARPGKGDRSAAGSVQTGPCRLRRRTAAATEAAATRGGLRSNASGPQEAPSQEGRGAAGGRLGTGRRACSGGSQEDVKLRPRRGLRRGAQAQHPGILGREPRGQTRRAEDVRRR